MGGSKRGTEITIEPPNKWWVDGHKTETTRLTRKVDMQIERKERESIVCSQVLNPHKQRTWNPDQRKSRALQTIMSRTHWTHIHVCLFRSEFLSVFEGRSWLYQIMKLRRQRAALWPFFSVTVAVCAPLIFFLSQMAHVITSASCLVSFIIGYDEPSISSQIYWGLRGKRRKWGRQRVDHSWPIISRSLTTHWS